MFQYVVEIVLLNILVAGLVYWQRERLKLTVPIIIGMTGVALFIALLLPFSLTSIGRGPTAFVVVGLAFLGGWGITFWCQPHPTAAGVGQSIPVLEAEVQLAAAVPAANIEHEIRDALLNRPVRRELLFPDVAQPVGKLPEQEPEIVAATMPDVESEPLTGLSEPVPVEVVAPTATTPEEEDLENVAVTVSANEETDMPDEITEAVEDGEPLAENSGPEILTGQTPDADLEAVDTEEREAVEQIPYVEPEPLVSLSDPVSVEAAETAAATVAAAEEANLETAAVTVSANEETGMPDDITESVEDDKPLAENSDPETLIVQTSDVDLEAGETEEPEAVEQIADVEPDPLTGRSEPVPIEAVETAVVAAAAAGEANLETAAETVSVNEEAATPDEITETVEDGESLAENPDQEMPTGQTSDADLEAGDIEEPGAVEPELFADNEAGIVISEPESAEEREMSAGEPEVAEVAPVEAEPELTTGEMPAAQASDLTAEAEEVELVEETDVLISNLLPPVIETEPEADEPAFVAADSAVAEPAVVEMINNEETTLLNNRGGENINISYEDVELDECISAGFQARAEGHLRQTIAYFVAALNKQPDTVLEELLVLDMTSIYKELGEYPAAAQTLRDFLIARGDAVGLELRRAMLNELRYVEILDKLLQQAGTPGLPIAQVPRLIKLRAQEPMDI